jgi:superfamily I DNA and/or RNA helicase
MIIRKDVSEFFDLEAEYAKKKWEDFMKLSVEERVHKRKAIENVYLDEEYSGKTPDNKHLLKLKVGVNLSDFSEGECVLLHRDCTLNGIKGTINSFDGDDIIIEVYGNEMPDSLDRLYKVPLILDKDCLDLRKYVYDKFLFKLPFEEEFWTENILNVKGEPKFNNLDDVQAEVEETIENFGLNFQDSQKEAIVKSLATEDYYLIQGPPGTGKSFVLSYIILEELAYFKHKVIVIGPNHFAINNALIATLKSYPPYSEVLHKVGPKYYSPKCVIKYNDEDKEINNMFAVNSYTANNAEFCWCIGLTPHSLYTSKARDLECDTLIIDEAGQMTIPLALMGMIKAKKVIFAGDYKQLPPIVTSDKISDKMKQSVFQRLITEENCTMLDVSFRMCKTICNFVSDLYYDGLLKPYNQNDGNKIICSDSLYSFDTPVVIKHIEDNGKQYSEKEAEFITSLVAEYLQKGLETSEIGILSPFRAQATAIRKSIRKSKCIDEKHKDLIVSETVDKMQGQEKEVIIFSLTAGDEKYIKEMADFIFNPNKLNVAFSRAKSKLIIVGNIEQIKQTGIPHMDKIIKSQYAKII